MTLITTSGPLDRRYCTTTTEGAGTYAVVGAVDGSYSDLSALNGMTVPYFAFGTTGWEGGTGVVGSSGATLTRNVLDSSESGDPVEWGPGTKNIIIAPMGEMLALLNRVNTYTTDAHQNFNGVELRLSPDGNYVLVATNSQVALEADFQTTTGSALTLTEGGALTFEYRHNSASLATGLVLYSKRESPADADELSPIRFRGNDDDDAATDYARLRPSAVDVSNGSQDGRLQVEVLVGGSLVSFLDMSGTSLIVPSTVNLLIGKSSANLTTQGCEFRGSGTAAIIAGAAQPLYVGRSNDGALLDWRISGSTVGTVSASSGVITYGTFSGAHYSRWGVGFEPGSDPPLGSLLCAVDEAYSCIDGHFERLPCVRLSAERGEKAIYGQFGGWEIRETEMDDAEIARLKAEPLRWRDVVSVTPVKVNKADAAREKSEGRGEPPARSVVKWRRMQVWALGTSPIGIPVLGPCEAGDLVMTSHIPGVAELAPESTDARRIVGKVFQPVPAGVTKLVRGVLHCG